MIKTKIWVSIFGGALVTGIQIVIIAALEVLSGSPDFNSLPDSSYLFLLWCIFIYLIQEGKD